MPSTTKLSPEFVVLTLVLSLPVVSVVSLGVGSEELTSAILTSISDWLLLWSRRPGARPWRLPMPGGSTKRAATAQVSGSRKNN